MTKEQLNEILEMAVNVALPEGDAIGMALAKTLADALGVK